MQIAKLIKLNQNSLLQMYSRCLSNTSKNAKIGIVGMGHVGNGSFQKVSVKNIWNFPYVGGRGGLSHFSYVFCSSPKCINFTTVHKLKLLNEIILKIFFAISLGTAVANNLLRQGCIIN